MTTPEHHPMADNDALIERLDAVVAELKALRTGSADRWLDADGVAAMLSTTRRNVLERLAPRPDFPPALRFCPGGHPRWKRSEIEQWAEQQRGRAA